MTGETITRLRAVATTDPYSGESTAQDWDNASSASIEGCAIWPGRPGRFAEPVIDARELVISDFVVAAPHGSDVTALDRLVIRGVTCEVVGRPFDYTSPFSGWEAGMVIQANVVEG